ncbi:MAG: DUF4914 family protein, partial [Phycisphaerales bacterium]|nr:DUF4914 family protein [Phycisphaerales bacterium]
LGPCHRSACHQANLLLDQIRRHPRTRYILCPNQHIGAWRTDFMPQWLAREYLARRGGARFRPGQLSPARCPLLGYALYSMQMEGVTVPHWFLEVNTQPEVGDQAYDKGAAILQKFFADQLKPYLDFAELDPVGKQIIEHCLAGAGMNTYESILPMT